MMGDLDRTEVCLSANVFVDTIAFSRKAIVLFDEKRYSMPIEFLFFEVFIISEPQKEQPQTVSRSVFCSVYQFFSLSDKRLIFCLVQS